MALLQYCAMGEIIWDRGIVHRFSNQIGPVSDWGYFLFAFFLPFPISVSRVFIFVLLILQLAEFLKEKPRLHFKYDLSRFLLALLFGVYAASLLYTKDLTGGIKQLEKAVPLLMLSLAFLFKRIDEKKGQRIFKAFLGGVFVMCIFLLGKALYNSLFLESGRLIFDPRVLRDPRITYTHSVNWGGNYFFSDSFIDFIHPSYFGMYLVFSVACLFYLWSKGSLSLRVAWLLAFIFIVILFLSSSRSSHLSLIVVVSLILMKNEFFSLRIKRIGFSIGIATLMLFVGLNPRWVEFFDLQDMIEGKVEYRGSVPERLMSWDASVNLIKESPFFGYGIGDVQSELDRTYEKLNYQRPLNESYNSHNQFLQTILCVGALGFIAFALVFFRLVVLYKNTNHILILSFIVVTLIHFSFESMLERYAGVVFFAFFYGLLNVLDFEKAKVL